MTHVSPAPERATLRCASCHTELSPFALSCPACMTLVHADRLKGLAASAEEHTAAERLVEARESWNQALELLPPGSQQYTAVVERVGDLTKRIDATPKLRQAAAASDGKPWWRRGLALTFVVALFAVSKLKFLILGLTKASTFVSMFAFFGVYWGMFGWPLALGLVVSLYIHEMGHVAELRHLGIKADAPLFIPGVGAFVLMRQRIDDPRIDARIGLAGPIYGLGAGVAAYGVFLATANPLWAAIAQFTGFLNLFNLIPIWQLDGSRGFHALSSWQRFAVIAAIAVTYYFTRNGVLLAIGAVAIYRAAQRAEKTADMRALITFVVLIAALSWLASVPAADLFRQGR